MALTWSSWIKFHGEGDLNQVWKDWENVARGRGIRMVFQVEEETDRGVALGKVGRSGVHTGKGQH